MTDAFKNQGSEGNYVCHEVTSTWKSTQEETSITVPCPQLFVTNVKLGLSIYF